MKKISAIFMSVMLAFSLTACADQGGSNSGESLRGHRTGLGKGLEFMKIKF